LVQFGNAYGCGIIPLGMVKKLKPVQPSLRNDLLEHQRLTSLINSMADAVIALDKRAKIVLYNGAALNLLDVNTITPSTSLNALFKVIDKNNQEVDLTSMIKDSKVATSSRNLRIECVDGSCINIYLSIAPVHVGYGEEGESGYVLLLRDITREKSLEEERDEFIGVVSHELRTPIAISEGNISNAQLIVERSGDMSTVKKALEEAHNQIIFLASMINDLSTLSRADRGKLEITIEPINVISLCEEIISNYAPEADKKHISILADIDPHLTLLYSSTLYVREILQNFITNAIKYTDRGHISVGAKTVEGGVYFTISDTGIGISRSDQERVFDKFFRSDDFRTRKTNGTGLGLYVTVKLARLLHADINLSSELNKGSTFTVFIPTLQ
jgi:PAS domain S-box-containing protein